jgi:hypothetical protein
MMSHDEEYLDFKYELWCKHVKKCIGKSVLF